jgi:hypothetical protein
MRMDRWERLFENPLVQGGVLAVATVLPIVVIYVLVTRLGE